MGSLKPNAWGPRIHVALFAIGLLGVLTFIYLFVLRVDRRFDLTAHRSFSLSEETRRLLDKAEPFEIHIFYHESQRVPLQTLKDLLENYRIHKPTLTLRYWELDREPVKASTYGVTRYGEVVLARGERREYAEGWSEEAVTQALFRMENETLVPVYFTEGHGELSLSGTDRLGLNQLSDELIRENYRPLALVLDRKASIPEDAEVLVLASPKNDFFDDEIEKLEQFLLRGGSLLVLLDPQLDGKTEKLEGLLRKFGFHFGTDVVVDTKSYRYGSDAVIVRVDRFSDHAIGRSLKGDVTLAMTRSVRPAAAEAELAELMVLAASSSESWAETDLKTLESGRAVYDEEDGDIGVVPLAVLAEGRPSAAKDEETKRSFRALAVGDSDFLTNALIRLGENKHFALSTIAWLSARNDLMTVKPRTVEATPLYLTSADRFRLFFSLVIGIPLLVLCSGLWVTARRRHISI